MLYVARVSVIRTVLRRRVLGRGPDRRAGARHDREPPGREPHHLRRGAVGLLAGLALHRALPALRVSARPAYLRLGILHDRR